jgi:integrase
VATDPVTAEALADRRNHQRKERLAAGELWADSGYVFTDEIGQPLHPQYPTLAFRRVVNNAGLPRIRLHDLRHTAATLALAVGVHPKVVSERIGHSTVGITLDTYSHVVEGLEAEAADRVGAIVFTSAEPRAIAELRRAPSRVPDHIYKSPHTATRITKGR